MPLSVLNPLNRSLRPAWREAWKDRRLRVHFAVTLPALAITLMFLTGFLEHVETRRGVVLPDPVLSLFAARDLTWLTFAFIYAGLLVAVGFLLFHPRCLLQALQVYIVMVIFRVGAMYLLPLDPPPGMIPLRDPFVEYFGTGKLLTRDLFFSGHTATLFLLALVMPGRRLKRVYLLLTAAVAFCVIGQHVHYTIDVFVAPFVAYASYRLIMILHAERKAGKFS